MHYSEIKIEVEDKRDWKDIKLETSELTAS